MSCHVISCNSFDFISIVSIHAPFCFHRHRRLLQSCHGKQTCQTAGSLARCRSIPLDTRL